MSWQTTWIGLTVTVYLCLIAASGVELLGQEIASVNGAENTTIRHIPGQRSLDETPANDSWSSWVAGLLDTPQNEQEQQGANYQGPTMGAAIYNLFIRGTVGFSTYAHNLVGITPPYTTAGEATIGWFFDLAQWFMVVGNALIIMQILGRIIPGGG